MPTSSLRRLFINFPEKPGRVEKGLLNSSGLKCWLQTAENFEGWKLARFISTKSTQCFLRRLAIALSSFQFGILWSETPFSLDSLLLLLLQPNTTHLSGIFGSWVSLHLQNLFIIYHTVTTCPYQNKSSSRSSRHKPLAPRLFQGTRHFVHFVLRGREKHPPLGYFKRKNNYFKEKRIYTHCSNILQFILKFFELTG